MEREFFEFVIKNMPKNSVKRACYIVREYSRYSKIETDSILTCEEGCAVSLHEYLEAVKVLLAYSYENSDMLTEVEQFACESDCSHNNGCVGFCNGEFSISKKSHDKTLKLCKYYSDSQFI